MDEVLTWSAAVGLAALWAWAVYRAGKVPTWYEVRWRRRGEPRVEAFHCRTVLEARAVAARMEAADPDVLAYVVRVEAVRR